MRPLHRALAILAFAVAALQSVPATAFDIKFPWAKEKGRIDVTWSMTFDYHHNNRNGSDDDDDHYSDLKNHLYLNYHQGDFTFGLRLDTWSFFSALSPGDPEYADFTRATAPPYVSEYVLEKIFLRVNKGILDFTAGDFYAVLGRGLALSLRRIDELAVDTTIRGGKLKVQEKKWGLTFLAGFVNAANIDGVSEKLIGESCTPSLPGSKCNPFRSYPNDVIIAGRLERKFFDLMNVGVHYLHASFKDTALPGVAQVAGGSIEFPRIAKKLSFIVEADYLNRSEQAKDGYALYVSANASLGRFTLLAEFKNYCDFDLSTTKTLNAEKYSSSARKFIYNEAPTLERNDQELDNNTNIRGFRFRLDYHLKATDTLFYANYGRFWHTHDDSRSYHFFIGVEQRTKGGLYAVLSGGLREEIDLLGNFSKQIIHIEGSLSLPLAGRFALQLKFSHQERYGNTRNYRRGQAELSFSYSPLIIASFIYGYNTEFEERMNRDRRVMEKVRQHFLAGALSLRFHSRVTIKLLAGALRGGLTCVAGQCREIPPFAGFRISSVLRY